MRPVVLDQALKKVELTDYFTRFTYKARYPVACDGLRVQSLAASAPFPAGTDFPPCAAQPSTHEFRPDRVPVCVPDCSQSNSSTAARPMLPLSPVPWR